MVIKQNSELRTFLKALFNKLFKNGKAMPELQIYQGTNRLTLTLEVHSSIGRICISNTNILCKKSGHCWKKAKEKVSLKSLSQAGDTRKAQEGVFDLMRRTHCNFCLPNSKHTRY